MSFTSTIPKQMRDKMSQDKFYLKCCIADETCSGRTEWHHNLIYAGKRQNELFCILPVCHSHHEREKDRKIGDKLDWIMYNRATEEDKLKYPRINWKQKLSFLNSKYGTK